MTDLYDCKPWYCDDDDCPDTWHLETYSFAEDTGEPISSSHSDGDWQLADFEDFPTPKDCLKAHIEYARWVAETGHDPLSLYIVKRENVRQVTWQVVYRKSIVGILVNVRKNGRGPYRRANNAPLYVQDYLGTDQRGKWTDTETLPELKEWAAESIAWQQVMGTTRLKGIVKIKETTARKQTAIARDLKKLARRDIGRMSAELEKEKAQCQRS